MASASVRRGMGAGHHAGGLPHRATPADIEEATRRWADAHNLFLETTVTSGVLGLIRSWRCSAAGRAGVASGSGARLEPGRRRRPGRLRHGRTAQPGPDAPAVPVRRHGGRAPTPGARRLDERTPRGVRLGVGIVLSLSLVVSLTMIAGATFERWGRHYGEEWAYRAALRVQPWRLTSTEQLALQLAAQGRAGDQQAGAEAKRLIAEGVERFPWDVNVRLWAADVDTLLNDPPVPEPGAASTSNASRPTRPCSPTMRPTAGSRSPARSPSPAAEPPPCTPRFPCCRYVSRPRSCPMLLATHPAAAPDRERRHG